ncbi:MAG: cytochrome c [Bacteroidota bacterium]
MTDGQRQAGTNGADLDARKLLRMSPEQLDRLFRDSECGSIPVGSTTGTALVCSGTVLGHLIAWFARIWLWQGKVFDAASKTLLNRVSLVGVKAIRANVYRDQSWVDQKNCTVLDYSKTSVVAGMVRDEVREVAPGLFLGPVFLWRKRTIYFVIDAHDRSCRSPWAVVLRWAAALGVLLAVYLGVRFTRDVPVDYASDEDHFKYGSTGGERASGIPYALWKVLPDICPEHLPGPGYQSLGFIFEPGHDLPVGVSKRNVQGIDRVFVNCAVCHAGTVRDTPLAEPRVYTGMPANTFDIEAFERFLFKCVADQRFTPLRLTLEIERRGYPLDFLNRALLQYYGIRFMRERLLTIADLFHFTDREPDYGPGRVDTFNPPKALLAFPMDKIPEREWIGITDFPSVWLQRQRIGMELHWDGNNTSVDERNRSAAFGTGAFPPTLDRASVKRMADYLLVAAPPKYPYPIDAARAARGQDVYRRYCADCHGQSGRDFAGKWVGKVTPIDAVGTDRHRLDSYSFELAEAQNGLYAGYGDERFSHFRKTFGYANMPLDGVWLRGPFLHNGSVPTLRDLLEPAAKRPTLFYRGYDVYDQARVGFVSQVADEKGHRYFKYDTAVAGNGNAGHEGARYGTLLSDDDKDAIVEHLKTF